MVDAARTERVATRRTPTLSGTAIWIPVVVIALLAMPMIVTKRSFGHDWTLHLWLIRQQQLNIESMSHPGLFVSVRPFGVFYPMFAFTGSGLYAIGGYLAILLGNRPLLAYKLLYLLGLGFAYGGMTWLSLQLGLRSWRSQVPGLVVVTGAYFVTDLAGRGDLGEFVALASIPMLIAAGRSVFDSRRIRARDVVAVVAATFLLTGSHNITLMWGSIFIVSLLMVSLLAFAPVGLPALPWARLATLAGAGAIGTGLNAWFLFPDLRYGFDTNVAGVSENKAPKTVFAKTGLLLNPLRPADAANSPYARDLRFSLPWMFALWAVVVAIILWRNREGSSKRAFVGVLGVSLVYVFFTVWQRAWNPLPHVLYNLQYAWRLHAYILLATAVLVLLALRWHATAPERVRRSTTIALLAVVVFNIGAATWQVWRVRSEYVRGPFEEVTGSDFNSQVVASRYSAPVSWYSKGAFFDASTPTIDTQKSRTLTIPVTAVHRSKFAGALPVPDGRLPFTTNISAARHLVTITGIRPVGRTFDGFMVAVRAPGEPPTGPITVTIAQVDSSVLRSGAAVSLGSFVLFVMFVLWALSRRFHRGLRPVGTGKSTRARGE